MSDSLNTDRKIRTFNVIDDYNRECLGIELDRSLPALEMGGLHTTCKPSSWLEIN
jgi:putative transposase